MAKKKREIKASATKMNNAVNNNGNYEEKDLRKKKKKELLEIARKLSLKNLARLTKDQLINRILKKETERKVEVEGPRKVEKQPSDEMEVKLQKFVVEDKEKFFEPKYDVLTKTRDLPPEYGDTKVTLLVRDPYWCFAYWEISPQTREKLGIPKGKHNKQMVLRVYDITGVSFDGSNANSYYDININDYANNWYINVPSPNRSYLVELGIIENGKFVLIARSNAVHTPRDTVSDIVDEEWAMVGENFEKIYEASGAYKMFEVVGSERIAKVITKNIEESISSGGLASSGMVPKMVKEKDFWLVVNCELIVYGATEPDAKLTIQGEEIKLRPDGTFSVRYALPDGKIVIPVKAVNKDGDMEKEIIPTVERSTEYKV